MRLPRQLARRLFRKLLPSYLCLAAVLTAIQVLTLYHSTRHAIDSELDYLSTAFSPSLSDALWAKERRQLADLAAGIARSPVINGIRITDDSGAIMIWAGEIDAAFAARVLPLSHAATDIPPTPVGQVELFSNSDLVWAQMRASLVATLLNSLGMAAALWALFFWVIHRELSLPLADLAEQLRHWRDGSAKEIPMTSYRHHDELGTLLGAFAETRSRLDSSLQALADMNSRLEDEVKRRTQELSEAKQRLELSLSAGRLGCWEWDLESGNKHFDARWKQMLGYTEDELADSLETLSTLVAPEDFPSLIEAIQSLSAGEVDQFRIDMRMRCKSGDDRWIQSCGEVSARAPDGRPLRLSGTHQDITERKTAEHQQLKAHAEKAQALSNTNTLLSQRVTERTRELEASNQSLRETLTQLESTHLQLAQSEKLAFLGKLVAMFAHDISNPISNSWMASGILEDSLKSIQHKHQNGSLRQRDLNDFLDTVNQAKQLLERNLERAHELLASFKDMALDQATSLRRSITLKPWLEQLAYTLSPMFKGKEIKLEFSIPSTLELNTCPGPLAQVITNLVGNALVHAFDPTVVDASQGRIRIEAWQDADQTICLSIADNGCGMNAELQERIFEPFFTTRPGQGGTGLGLDIVRSIVTQSLQGRISLESQPGRGSCFTIHLPPQAAH